jgi:BirA family biotin operon repressor/biotin-[acetyl-CoA-carboxylase] ligase
MAIFASEQTAGKGQRGKKWISSKGKNIALSIVLNPSPLSIAQQFQLCACIAVAIHLFFQKHTGQEARIKWPNDLYWKNRKAGGILIENVVRSFESGVRDREPGAGKQNTGLNNWLWAVVGIGININQTNFPPELQNPVSLKQITGKNFDPIELAKEVCGFVNDQFEELITHGFENTYAQYCSHLYQLNEKVRLKKVNRVFEAEIKSVSPAGRLIVQHGIEEEFDFGEIEWVIEKTNES